MELAGIISDYDRIMQEKQNEIDQLKELAQIEGKELQALQVRGLYILDTSCLQKGARLISLSCLIYKQEHFDRLAGNEAQIRLENDILASIRKREEEALKKMNKGASRLQAVFRGKKARAEVAKMKTKTKKGDGGKKKK